MARILHEYTSYDGQTMLAAFQAYVLYVMTQYFQREQIDRSVLRQNPMHLQQIASSAASIGTTTLAELCENRPDWSQWILVESKRRTIYTMYLFDNLLCASDQLPTCVAVELSGLLAPSGRALWEANSLQEWTRSYNLQMSAVDGGGLRIEELWPAPGDASQEQLRVREGRVSTWLEDLDLFGNMLFAVTSATYSSR